MNPPGSSRPILSPPSSSWPLLAPSCSLLFLAPSTFSLLLLCLSEFFYISLRPPMPFYILLHVHRWWGVVDAVVEIENYLWFQATSLSARKIRCPTKPSEIGTVETASWCLQVCVGWLHPGLLSLSNTPCINRKTRSKLWRTRTRIINRTIFLYNLKI